jgi:hypothetical protein
MLRPTSETLMMRWFAARDARILESDDPVNYRYVDDGLESLAGTDTGKQVRFNFLNPLAAATGFFRSGDRDRFLDYR